MEGISLRPFEHWSEYKYLDRILYVKLDERKLQIAIQIWVPHFLIVRYHA